MTIDSARSGDRGDGWRVIAIVATIALLVAVGTGCFAILTTHNKADTADVQSTVAVKVANGIQEGLIDGCQQNGNPLRRGFRKLIHRQNKIIEEQDAQTKQFLASGKFNEFFPNVPPAKLDRLIQEGLDRDAASIERNLELARTVGKPVNCVEQYTHNGTH